MKARKKVTEEDIVEIARGISRLLDEKKAEQCLRLIEQLEEQDDVQNVYSNYEIPDAIMTRIGEGR